MFRKETPTENLSIYISSIVSPAHQLASDAVYCLIPTLPLAAVQVILKFRMLNPLSWSLLLSANSIALQATALSTQLEIPFPVKFTPLFNSNGVVIL